MRTVITGILVLILLGAGCQPNPDNYVYEATTWVETTAPTYLYDGYDLHLKEVVQGGCSSCWDIYLDFTSSAAGYGDRSQQVSAQVITDHTTRIRFLQGEIIEVITDQIYDEQHARKLESIFLNEPVK